MSNTDAMASPTPAAIRKPRAIFPPTRSNSDQIVMAKAQELNAQATNISDSTQLYRPFAYSLTTRNDGSNSGLSTCKAASNRRTVPAAPIATQAASTEGPGVSGLEKAEFVTRQLHRNHRSARTKLINPQATSTVTCCHCDAKDAPSSIT